MSIIIIYSTDENSTPYQIMRNAIDNGDIIDILQLSEKFYDELKECLEEEDEYEDEIICPKESIVQLMSNRFQSCSEESMTMKMILEKVGFDSQFAEDFANHIEADPLDMTLWDWIHHFVFSTLDHLWMKKYSDGPEDESNENINTTNSTDSAIQQKKGFKVLNMFQSLQSDDFFPELLLNILAKEVGNQTSDKMEFWFHGTSPKCANDIMTNGITLKNGKAKANYSNECGFYLTDNLNLAIRFASKKFCISTKKKKAEFEEIAVVVFALEKEKHEHYFPKTNDKGEETGIDLRPTAEELKNGKLKEAKDKRLRNIVIHFSEGEANRKEVTLEKNGLQPRENGYKYEKKLKFIVGPYTDFQGIPWNNKKKENVQIYLDQTQLCLKSEEITDEFEELKNPIVLSLKMPKGFPEMIKASKKKFSRELFLDYIQESKYRLIDTNLRCIR
jgi:hypothetical protein